MVVIEGPRFSTRAESRWYASLGGTIVNMTGHPEAVLARELGICYTAVALVTDHDAGVEGDHGVTQEEVFRVFGENTVRLRDLLLDVVAALPLDADCVCQHALDGIDVPEGTLSRQADHEAAPTVHIAHRHLAAVRLDEATHDRKPQAATATLALGRGRRTGRASPKRHVEDAGQVGRRNSAAAVGHREPAPRVLLAAGQGDRAVGRGVPDRVAQQVGHDPGQLRLAALYGRPAGLGGDQPYASGGGHRRRPRRPRRRRHRPARRS